MNNKGLTLVELLAVIAIIALLLTIAMPKIGDVIETSRKNTFLGEAQGVYRIVKIKALDIGGSAVIYSKGSIKLDMDGNDLDYCIILDSDTSISSITVSNGKYIIEGDNDFMTLDVSSVREGNMDSFVCE